MLRVALSLALLLAAAPATVSAQSPAASKRETQAATLAGDWSGLLDTGQVKLRVRFRISPADAGGWAGVMESLDQGGGPLPLSQVTREGSSVTFDAAKIGGSFKGELAAGGAMLTGRWSQGPASLPLTLTHSDAAPITPPRRPQTPATPYPYKQEDVSFLNPAARIRLAGTLTLPPGQGPFPAVVLISGSGPQNRDEEILGHKPFLILADDLTRRGVAVLRVDDRGVAASQGDFSAATSFDFAEDVQAAVTFLRSRHDVASRRIGLIGHSEGGMIAPLVASRDPQLAFVVLLAGPGVPGDQILLAQDALIARATGVPETAISAEAKTTRDVLDLAKRAPDRASARQAIVERLHADGVTGAAAEAQARRMSSDWLRAFLKYDPAATLRLLRLPVLAVGGSLDLQVPTAQNLPALRESLKNDPDVTVLELPGLNHLFQHAKTGSPAEYATIEETFAPEALKIVGEWVVRRSIAKQP